MERSKRKIDNLLLAFTAWMADRQPRPLRPITRKEYVMAVRRAMHIAGEGEHSIMAGDVRAIRFVLGKCPPHPSSQNVMLAALASFYDFLKVQGIRKDNPTDQIPRHPRPRRSPRPISIEDCCSYLEAATTLGTIHHLIATLGLYMGLRIDEVRRLRWADFFEADGRLWCDVDGKGGRRERAFVHAQIRRLLAEQQRKVREAPYIFPSPVAARFNQPVADGWVRRRHLEIVDEADIAFFTFHQLRHSFATYLRRSAGADPLVVKKGLRHAALSSTEIYMGVLDDEIADFIARLDFTKFEKEDEAE